MSDPFEPFDPENTSPVRSISTTTANLIAIRLKSANKNIFRALLSLASAALLIRVMGMVNQVVVTGRFGQGTAMDAYFVASSFPILFAQLLISGLESSVIPVFTRVRTPGKREKASLFFSTLLNILLIGGILLTVVMLIFRRQVILLSAPALDPVRMQFAIDLAPYIFPVLLLMVINGFMECLLNAEGQFGWPAYAGILVPLTTAALVLIAANSQGIIMLCIGTIAGQLLQLGAIILRARHSKLVYRPVINLRSPELATTMMVVWPSLLSALISQASPLVDQIFASSLSTGSISALNYSLKLISVPVGVIFASVARAALPYLSQQAAVKDMKAFKETLRLYIWGVGIGTVVLTAFMIVLAHPIVQILFQRGAFTAEDTNRTASTLIGFSIGLIPMSIGFVTVKAFSALSKTRILMYTTMFSVFANAIFDAIFAHFWQSFGIALATSAMYVCSMFVVLIILRRTIGKLELFTPPTELLNLIGKTGMSLSNAPEILWKDGNFLGLSYRLRQQILRTGIVLTVFAVGVIGVLTNALYTLRASLGSIVILALLRYRYVLLMTWVSIDAFIGSSVPFFNGNNFDTGLIAPTLLLMTCMPIEQTFKRLPALAFLFVFLLWVLGSIGFSPVSVSDFITEWLIRLTFVAIGVLTIQLLTTRHRMMLLIDAILLLCTVISLYGIYGFFTKQNGEMDLNVLSLFRISSIFGTNAPSLALFLSLIIPLVIYRTITLQGFKRILILIQIIIYLATLVLTFTRAAFIIIPISIVVMSFFMPSRKMRVGLLSTTCTLAVLAIIVALTYHLPVFDRFLSQDVTTVNNRTYLWQALLDHFDPTQFFGKGLHASDDLLANLQIGYGGVIGTSPHNLFLGTLYDHGIIGVALLILVFVALFVNIIKGMLKATGDHRVLFAAALAVVINMLSQVLDSNDIWIQGIGLYFWIIVALPFALCWSTSKAPKADSAPQIENDQEDLTDETELTLTTVQKVERESVLPL